MNKPINAIFILNPISGTKSKDEVQSIIDQYLSGFIQYKIISWKSTEQNLEDEIASSIIPGKTNVVIGIGGDGTVNRIASNIINSENILGILPFGSGNGLARHLKIPVETRAAIDVINRGKICTIDSGIINNQPFFTSAGVGFDAYVTELYNKSKTRGFETYLEIVVTHFINYPSQQYEILIDDKQIIRDDFLLISVANASQFGSNAYIAPKAIINDGYLDVVLFKKPQIIDIVNVSARLFNRTLHLSKYVQTYKAKHIVIKREKEGVFHFDGEPGYGGTIIEFSCLPASLNVLVSPKFTKF